MSSDRCFGQLPDDAELLALTAAFCDGTADAAQRRRLSELIESDPRAAEFYVAHVQMHAQLQTLLGAKAEATVMNERQRGKVERAGSAGAARRLSALASLSVAAAVVLVVAGLLVLRPDRVATDGGVIARMELAETGAVRELRAGEGVRHDTGTGVIRMRNGVDLLLSAPVDLHLNSDMEVLLKSGALKASVSEAARGFRVLTETTDVIDLGTVFGVGVGASGATEVVVFEGEVDVGRRDDSGVAQDRRRIYSGEAVRSAAEGEPTRIPLIWQDSREQGWSLEEPSETDAVIASVSDNLSEDARPKFYAIVPGGFGEDAKAYVDRVHEWNGMDAGGLPEELVGGDYLQTFNDDRSQNSLVVTVTLARSATLYVLLDQRVAPPEWLRTDFEKTELTVGLDEGDRYLKHAGLRRLPRGEGPGNSIDFPFSVWKRVIPSAGPVALGPLCPEGGCQSRAMYGIVAVPLPGDL